MIEDTCLNLLLILRLLQVRFCEVPELLAAFEKLKNFEVCYHIRQSISPFLCLFLIGQENILLKDSVEVEVSSCAKDFHLHMTLNFQ